MPTSLSNFFLLRIFKICYHCALLPSLEICPFRDNIALGDGISTLLIFTCTFFTYNPPH